MMYRKWVFAISILIFLSLYFFPGFIRGEEDIREIGTVNDVLALYGMPTYPSSKEIENEYLRVALEYEGARKKVEKAKNYNHTVTKAEEFRASEISGIDQDIKEILIENKRLSEEISVNIRGDINYLLSLDANYKNNLAQADSCLREQDKYTVSERVNVPSELLYQVEEEFKQAEYEWNHAVRLSNIGEVKNVKAPVDVPYVKTSSFGSRINPVTKETIERHNGLDMRAPANTDVLALFDGVVAEAGTSWAAGNYIKLNHGNGLVSFYGHLNQHLVSKGDKVRQYAVIALSGNTGALTTGPHLHLGLFIYGMPVDPEILFLQQGVKE